MPSIPRDYLEKVAHQKRLTSFQKEAFVERLANIDLSDLVIAKILNISRDRYSSRMTQVYKKFNVPSGNIPGKSKLLFFEVLDMYRKENPDAENASPQIIKTIDEFVHDAQNKTQNLIKGRCGKMQILDMNEPIEVKEIFTEVKITDQIASKRRIELKELVAKYEHREQTSKSKFTISRLFDGDKISGVQLIEKYPKLMLLGRPGAGKTTFLKYVATLTNRSEVVPDHLPVFIALKDFQEKDAHIDLRTHIENELSLFEVNKELFNKLLKESRVLFLFDGLDEVRKKHFSRVVRQIRELSQLFSNNRFIITCRLAASEYKFEDFLEVEVCEFTKSQISLFAKNWFAAKGSTLKTEKFLTCLDNDPEISELATNPLLLTLLCLVFEESGEFPHNQVELYQEGLDIFLRKWDVTREIERPETYRKLSKNKKEDLLSKIAYATFEKDKGLFKKATIEAEIREYTENLLRSIRAPEEVDPDCSSILKSMVAQHGLIVEVAKGIYSFSHRTFHEYFVALKIVKTLDPQEQIKILKSLTTHINDYRWQEVFILVSCMLPNADFLIRLIKREIDKIVEENQRIGTFIHWLTAKSASIKNPQNLSNFHSICQVFYFNLVINQKITKRQKLSKDFVIDSELIHTLNYSVVVQNKIAQAASLSAQDKIDDAEKTLQQEYERLLRYLKENRDIISEPDILAKFDTLATLLPTTIHIPDPWWPNHGDQWIQSLRDLIIRHRNIGHDWGFTSTELNALKEYYTVNKLLSRCLQGDCYVSREVREEINVSTLLPIEKSA
ncbi:NACHT domain-containing protein [Leptothoe kymatousa]|uniref:NACHT domain-containing protein n=1 Tax=Leptothoe kymatousa TAU-MAC 1615 TaxID=2364775 RepID=A0ABS5XZN5_9CYAN|nr:NACHT domain-containing protein [Leptothoe kymatousa]MBT9311062.1 NACHT domain-containing protein [Leptothoe kymatousa TAU-MAC 1615]